MAVEKHQGSGHAGMRQIESLAPGVTAGAPAAQETGKHDNLRGTILAERNRLTPLM
jgi:hypothetical protein